MSDVSEEPGLLAAAVAMEVCHEIQVAGLTEQWVVQHAEWLHATCEDGHIPMADGTLEKLRPFPLRPGLADRLRGLGGALSLDDLQAVAFILGQEDALTFAARVCQAGEKVAKALKAAG